MILMMIMMIMNMIMNMLVMAIPIRHNKNSLFIALIGIHIFTDELSPAPMLGLCLGTFYIFSLLSLLYIYIYVKQQALALGLNMDLE